MAQGRSITIIRQIGLSEILAKTADHKAKQLGISTPEYIRHLIVQDNEDKVSDSEQLSEKAEKRYYKDLVEFFKAEATHPTKGFNSVEEMMQHLDQV